MSVIGRVSEIARTSLHDGPGIRTTVYLKGCAMRCKWCHNPESLSAKREILFRDTLCMRCGACAAVCPDCHGIGEKGVYYDRAKCTLCGKCVEACPTGALKFCGDEMTDAAVFEVVRKDKRYFGSKGGVTLSGGECLLQADFCEALLKRCRDEGISTCIETALFVSRAAVEKVLPLTDLCFTDLKLPDDARCERYTGKPLKPILENMRYVSEHAARQIVRIPLIPTVNDGEADMRAFAAIIRTLGPACEGVELLPYNPLGESKYRHTGRTFTRFGDAPQDAETVSHLKRVLIEENCNVIG